MISRSRLSLVRSRPISDIARYRWSVASRSLAAIVGGYIVTSLFNLAVPLLIARLGVNLPQAILGVTGTSFLLYAAIIMAVFHARSATRAWAWLACTSLLLAVVAGLCWPEAAL